MYNTKRVCLNNIEYDLIFDYKNDQKNRHSLNRLVMKTYGFDFEDWYSQGYWSERYRPYSLIHNNEIVANVSVNPIDFLINGEVKRIIQIGTVMTEEDYRHRGLSKFLLDYVLTEYQDESDMIYLYANDSVLEFYPRFGFVEAEEYYYTKRVKKSEDKIPFRKLNMTDEKDKAIITRLTANTKPVARYQMINNRELLFFYLNSFMANDIYYFEDIDLATVAMMGEHSIELLDIYCENEFDLDHVIGSLANEDSHRRIHTRFARRLL